MTRHPPSARFHEDIPNLVTLVLIAFVNSVTNTSLPIEPPQVINTLQDDINQILNWTKYHGLTFISPVLLITFSRPIPLHLKLGPNPIQTASSMKSIGVIIKI